MVLVTVVVKVQEKVKGAYKRMSISRSIILGEDSGLTNVSREYKNYMSRYIDEYLALEGKSTRDLHTYYCPWCHKKELKTYDIRQGNNVGKRAFKCNNCHKRGDVYDLIQYFEGIDRLPARYSWLCNRLNIDPLNPIEGAKPATNVDAEEAERARRAKQYLQECNQDLGVEVWAKRGITVGTIREYGLTYNLTDNALVIPFSESSYVKRFLNHSKYRYIECMPKHREGGRRLISKEVDPQYPMILVEGEIDMLSLVEVGYPNVMSLGSLSNLENEYERLVCTSNYDIVLGLDYQEEEVEKSKRKLYELCQKQGWRLPIDLWPYLNPDLLFEGKDINDYLLHNREFLIDGLALLKETKKKDYGEID